MPTFTRKALRTDLGKNYLRDTIVGTTTASRGAQGSLTMIDALLANLDMSGQGLYQRSFLRVASADYIVGTFNVATGALMSAQAMVAAIPSGADYELANLLPANEKDAAIDDAISRIRIRQEVALWTVDGALFYPIDGAASPYFIETVMDAYYFANPTGTADRDQRNLEWFEVSQTPTGTELRISPRLSGSQQIVMDALLAISLGASDAATVNIPDERLVLWGAEAQAWGRLMRRSPGTNTEQYQKFQDDAARQYSQLASRFKKQVARKLTFDQPVRRGVRPWNW